FARVLVTCVGLMAFLILCTMIVLGMRLGTSLTIPGWTTTMVGELAVMVMQAAVLVIITTLMVMSGRSSRPFIPIVDSLHFVRERRVREFRRSDAVGTVKRVLV